MAGLHLLVPTGDFQSLIVGTGGCGLLGIAVGAVLKRAVRWLALVIGFMAIILKVLTWLEMVEVHWDRVEQKMLPLIDVNADGLINDNDIQHLVLIGKDIMTEGLPNVAGFFAGMMVALRFL